MITDRIDNITLIPENYRTGVLPAPPSVKIELSARCNYRCLRGDTLVDTMYGQFPIKELAEKYDTIPVYTYKDGEVFISDAVNIQKIGVDESLVRVRFDDDSYIDCTPDHQFLRFKSGRGPGTIETPTEAQDLQPGNQVRAYRLNEVGNGYINVCAGRNFRKKRSRLVMEYLMGRELLSTEMVHHKDMVVSNDYPDNLEYVASHKAHAEKHPEVAQRMRENNPAKNMTPEWREKITKAVTGKVRSLEQRQRYRDSKLGTKNPNYKDGKTAGRTRIVNHKVVSVEVIESDDVYCLEVPETGWFFANRVLVKNCNFCALVTREKQPKTDIDFDLFKRITTEMMDAGVEEVGLFYIGESFMNVSLLVNAIRWLKSFDPAPFLFLTTNGSLATPDALAEVMAAGLDSLKFSVTTNDAEQFEQVIGVSSKNMHAATQNIRHAWRIREENGFNCELSASSIKYDEDQAAKMQPHLDKNILPFVDRHYWLPLYTMGDHATANELNLGMKPTAGNMGRLDNMRDPLPCWLVSREGHVTAKGLMSACGFDATDSWIVADLNEVSFMQGWNSDEFVELREAHLRKDVTGTICETCILYNS